SRVIYDTTSHPDISGQVAPNFGYAASTQEADLNKVTSHSVNITGLNPGTKYYFRVLSQG
ncbi:MAG: fibronectin type III domain-containing protein, partial [Candidatus Paceibacterota bacterium]